MLVLLCHVFYSAVLPYNCRLTEKRFLSLFIGGRTLPGCSNSPNFKVIFDSVASIKKVDPTAQLLI